MQQTNHAQHFLQAIARNHHKLTFIGMSGLGKSHWSKALQNQGFKRFCCDNLIATRLLDACVHPDGKIGCLGQWMGLPLESGYQDKARDYLDAETAVLRSILAYLESTRPNAKVVIDTTGSAPYAGEAIMERLRELTHVVHLAVSPSVMDDMLARYIQSPRPVLWGDLYTKRPAETDHEALARSYKDLLAHREALYLKYAHQSIPYELHHTNEYD